MVGVLSLSHTATLVAVETLLQHPPEVGSWLVHRLHQLLQSDYYSTVSGAVLERLCTYYPHKVTDDILLSLAPPDLHELHLKECDRVTSNGITTLLQKCQRLTSLCLQDCRCAGNLLCDVSVSPTNGLDGTGSIQHPGYNLMCLDLSRCELVTDTTVKNILHHVSCLKQLHLVACTGITDEVFLLDEKRQLMRNERKQQNYSCFLTAVNISGCSQLTSTAVRHLTTLCGPSLRCINISATGADCTALLFLSGYSMLTSLHITKQMDCNTLPDMVLHEDEVPSAGQNSACECKTSKKDRSGSVLPADSCQSACQMTGCTRSSPEHTCSVMKSKVESSTSASDPSNHGWSDIAGAHDESTSSKSDTLQEPTASNSGESKSLNCESACSPINLTVTFPVKVMPVLNFSFSQDTVKDQSEIRTIATERHHDVLQDWASRTPNCSNCLVMACGKDEGSQSDFMSSSTNLPSVSLHSKLSGTESDCFQTIDQSSSQPSLSVPSETCLQTSIEENIFEDPLITCQAVSRQADHETEQCPGCSESRATENISHDDLMEGKLHSCPDSLMPIYDKCTGVTGEERQEMSSSHSTMDSHHQVNNGLLYPSVYQPNLEAVDLSYIELGDCKMGVICLHHLLARNHNIQQLSLSWKELDDEILEMVIVENAPNLKSISLVDCQGLTTYGVAVLCDVCDKLSVLNLQGVNFVQDRGVSGIIANGHVVRLGLSETMITDYTLSKVATVCADKLRDLDLSWCEEITDEGINQVVQHCTNLQHCLLRRCPVTEEALHLVAKNCTNLQHLNISGINTLIDGHMVAIALKLKHLNYLDISWNLDVTDVGVSALLRYSYSLQTLIATGVKQITSAPFWPLVSDVQAFKKCKALLVMERKLRDEQRGTNCVIISSDEDDDDVFSIPLRSTCYAPNLNQLQLEWCDCVSDSDLAEIVLVCRGSLHITDYYGIKVQPAIVVNTKPL